MALPLVEQSDPTPEVHSSNPGIGKYYRTFNITVTFRNNEKVAGDGQFKEPICIT